MVLAEGRRAGALELATIAVAVHGVVAHLLDLAVLEMLLLVEDAGATAVFVGRDLALAAACATHATRVLLAGRGVRNGDDADDRLGNSDGLGRDGLGNDGLGDREGGREDGADSRDDRGLLDLLVADAERGDDLLGGKELRQAQGHGVLRDHVGDAGHCAGLCDAFASWWGCV